MVQISKIYFLHAGAGAKGVNNDGFHSNIGAKSWKFWRYHEIEFLSIKLMLFTLATMLLQCLHVGSGIFSMLMFPVLIGEKYSLCEH